MKLEKVGVKMVVGLKKDKKKWSLPSDHLQIIIPKQNSISLK